jgi:hypothetical protein
MVEAASAEIQGTLEEAPVTAVWLRKLNKTFSTFARKLASSPGAGTWWLILTEEVFCP